MNDKPKCEEIGFNHDWEDTTPDIVYATYPPQYPPRQRRCTNCGREEVERTVQSEIKRWEKKDL